MHLRHAPGWIAVFGCLLAVSALAQPAPAGGDAGEAGSEEQELLALLAEETELATKTRMNSDWVPGILTVLQGDELEALGVTTAWEALSLVPGVQLVRDQRGSPSMTVRGLDFIFNTGNTKVLVNGVSMSRESAGVNNAILYMPIEQIERIEMIRGPGSAIHGDFAFSGLVNIVTRTDTDRVTLRATSAPVFEAVLQHGWAGKADRWRVGFSASALTSDHAEAPDDLVVDEERRAVALHAEGPFGAFRAQLSKRKFAPIVDPPGPSRDLDEENRALSWNGRYALGGAWSLDARASWSETHHDTLPGRLFDGDVFEAGIDFLHHVKRNDFLVGLSYWSGDIDHAIELRPPPAPPLNVAGETRTIRGITFQNQFHATGDLSLIVGARWDEFSDIGSQLSPRLAVVWRAAERHVVKFQHAEAFRAPTFWELAVPPGVTPPEAERIATTEASWIYRRPHAVVRSTLFHSELEDGLGPGPGGRPANVRSARVNGVEAEWTQSIADKVKIITNVSYVDPSDDSLVFAWSRFLGNLAVIAEPCEQLEVALRWHHVGTRHASTGDEFDGYDVVDVTFTIDDFGWEGGSLRVGVKNALGEDVTHPIPTPRGNLLPVYDDRVAWLAVAFEW